MNIFRNYTLKWWQMSLLKISLLLVGIAIGAMWPQCFNEHIPAIAGIGLILGVYIAYTVFKKR